MQQQQDGSSVAPLAEFAEIEQRVDAGEAPAIWARWECGKILRDEREANGGKQLPNGRMDEVCEVIGKSPAEVRYRIQFADQYRTADEVSTAVETCRSWTEIRHTLRRPRRTREAHRPRPRSRRASDPSGGHRPEPEDAPPGSWLTYFEEFIDAAPEITPLSPDASAEDMRRARAILNWLTREAKQARHVIDGAFAAKTDAGQEAMAI